MGFQLHVPLNTFSRTDITSRTSRPTPLSDLINFLLVEWGKIPTDTLQNLAESLSKRAEDVRVAKLDKLHTGINSILMPVDLE